MKFNFSDFWKRLLNPPTWAKVITFIVTVASATVSIILAIAGFDGSWRDIVAYVLFGVAGLSLAYSVYLIIPVIPKIKNKIVNWLESKSFTNRVLHDFGFKTIVTAVISFAMSLLNSVLNGYLGIANKSIWYGALSAFYIALAFVRGSALLYHGNRLGKNAPNTNDEQAKAKVYLRSGIYTLVLNVALSVAIAQMIFSNAHFEYVGWTIFASAAYAFYKITMSIISFVKAQKQTDLTVRAIRNINLVDALVSILALQTGLLSTFADGTMDVSLMNTLTGTAVSLSSIGIGIYMIVSANKKLKQLQKDVDKNEQQI
ncbi:MAG: hypothetical protein IJX23_02865 [Clostridia bacterium]|nr:hypothetical protein [Clostridia bacterium]